MKRHTYTRKDAEQDLNEIGTPEDDKRSNGGRIPDRAKYGTWMRRNDPVAFNIHHQDTAREIAFRNPR